MHHPKKWGGALVIFWDAPGMLWLTLETLQDAPRRSRTPQGALGHSGAFWRTLWGALWTLCGWMDDADDGGGDGDGDGEDLRLSFLYIQTPDQPPPRPLC